MPPRSKKADKREAVSQQSGIVTAAALKKKAAASAKTVRAQPPKKQSPAAKSSVQVAGQKKGQPQKSAAAVANDNNSKKKRVSFTDKSEENKEAEELKRKATQLQNQNDDDVEESSSDDDQLAGEGDDQLDNLSDLADSQLDSDEDDDNADEHENPFVKARRDGTRLSYSAVRLRFLPPEFQEPQLYQFLNQFKATVLNCFCVRSNRTHQPKGTAYVQFDDPSVIPLVVEECHGMLLGGRSVSAERVTLHRPFPTKEKVFQRRKLASMIAARGAPLYRHNIAALRGVELPSTAAGIPPSSASATPSLSPAALEQQYRMVGALKKYAQKETENNAHLKRNGIDYSFKGFTEQLSRVPQEFVLKKGDVAAKRELLKEEKKKTSAAQALARSNGKNGRRGGANGVARTQTSRVRNNSKAGAAANRVTSQRGQTAAVASGKKAKNPTPKAKQQAQKKPKSKAHGKKK